jgi:hypothetical protein
MAGAGREIGPAATSVMAPEMTRVRLEDLGWRGAGQATACRQVSGPDPNAARTRRSQDATQRAAEPSRERPRPGGRPRAAPAVPSGPRYRGVPA